MQLQTLQIEGFRSLKSVTWKPGRLNVLIGPNGGGKSNLLRAMDLIRVAAKGELRETILRMGGMAPLVWDGVAKKIGIRLMLQDPATANSYEYRFQLQRLSQSGSYEIENDQLTFFKSGSERTDAQVGHRPKLEDSVFPDWIQPGKINGGGLPGLMPLLPTEAAISLRRWAGNVQLAILDWSIYSDLRVDQEAELRRAAVTRSESRIEPDGQNLIPVLHTLYEGNPEFKDLLDSAMSAAFPDDYDKLTFPPAEDGRIQMRVRRKHRKKADSTADLSDGTLRFLLLATILGSPDPAPLIAIDEPETGLHPRMLPIIAEMAANASMRSQVILSTHAPQLLDAFGEELPTTTIVMSNGSETELKTIEGEELKRWVANYSLSKFAFSGEAEALS